MLLSIPKPHCNYAFNETNDEYRAERFEENWYGWNGRSTGYIYVGF